MKPEYFTIPEDIGAAVRNVKTNLDPVVGKACQMTLLSSPTSYLYMPWAVQTMTQLTDIMWVEAQWAGIYTKINGEAYPLNAVCTGGAGSILDQVGCPSTWPTIWEMPYLGEKDVTNEELKLGGYKNRTTADEGGQPLPSSYYRLREGVERFFITDINNPASGSVAQSQLPVMWDAWSGNANVTGDTGIVYYNHVPGGSNVLYVDGHVEFVRFGAKFPVHVPKDGAGVTGGDVPGRLILFGGWS